jgi:hypothetical protein
LGVGWLLLDAAGSEWDYCAGGGGDCIAGWKMGLGFTVAATLLAVGAVALLRRQSGGSNTDQRVA